MSAFDEVYQSFTDQENKKKKPSQIAAQTNKIDAQTTSTGKASAFDAVYSETQGGKKPVYSTDNIGAAYSRKPEPQAQPAAPQQQPSLLSSITSAVTSAVQKLIPQLNPANNVAAPSPTSVLPTNGQITNPGIKKDLGTAQVGGVQSAQPSDIGVKQKNIFDSIPSLPQPIQDAWKATKDFRNEANAQIGDALKYPLGKPAYAPANEQDLANLQKKYGESTLAKTNDVVGQTSSGILTGYTGGIVKPNTGQATTTGGSIGNTVGSILGSVASVKRISQGVSALSKFLQTGTTAEQLISTYPTVAKYAIPIAESSASFAAYGQLDPDQQDRVKRLALDSLGGVAAYLIGAKAEKAVVALPAAFGVGYGLARMDGANNTEAVKAGAMYVLLEAIARAGKPVPGKEIVPLKDTNVILKTEAANNLSELSGMQITKDSPLAEIKKAYGEAAKKYQITDAGGDEALYKKTVESYKALTTTDFAKWLKESGRAEKQTQPTQQPVTQQKSLNVFTPEEAAIQVQHTDLAGTPAGDTIMKAVEQAKTQGKDIQITIDGTGSIKTQTEAGTQLGLDFVDKREGEQVPTNQQQGSHSVQAPTSVGLVPVPFTPAKGLTPAETKVETSFGKQLNDNYEASKNEYFSKFGNVLNTDNARELSKDYVANKSQLSPAVHEPASKFIQQLYKEELQKPAADGKKNEVLFTAGGTGAGKTTAINTTPEFKNSADEAQIVYDTNLSTYDSSKEKIDQALAAGKDVQIIYVTRDPVVSMMKGAVPRAIRMGRTVPIDTHVSTHVKSLETIKKLAAEYAGNDRVDISIIDNNGDKSGARLVPLANIANLSYNTGDVTNTIRQKLQSEYESGKISKSLYENFTRSSDLQRTGPEKSPVSSENSQSSDTKVKTPKIPHTDGKSRLRERIEAQLLETDASKYQWDEKTGSYDKMTLKANAEAALTLLEQDPVKALRIAQGLENAPETSKEGATGNAISLAVAFKARDEGDYKLWTDVVTKTSLRSSRYGQEIVSLRGQVNDNSPENMIKRVLDARLEKLGKNIIGKAKKVAGKVVSNKTKAFEKIDKEVEKVKEYVKKERNKIKLAQDIIDSLKCT